MRTEVSAMALKILIHYYFHCYSYISVTVDEDDAREALIAKGLIKRNKDLVFITQEGRDKVSELCYNLIGEN